MNMARRDLWLSSNESATPRIIVPEASSAEPARAGARSLAYSFREHDPHRRDGTCAVARRVDPRRDRAGVATFGPTGIKAGGVTWLALHNPGVGAAVTWLLVFVPTRYVRRTETRIDWAILEAPCELDLGTLEILDAAVS